MAGARESEGLVLLAGLALLAAAGGWAAARLPVGSDGAPRRVRLGAVAAVAVVGLALVAGSAAVETGTPDDGATAARLGSTDSNRYAYWRVAVDGFAGAPLRGHGAGAFGVLWLRDRTVPEVVRDAHSIWLETAAELGLVGLLLLAAFAGGIAWSAVLARRRDAARLAGPAAALAVWAAHSAIDWDWELPGGPTLTAIVLAGLVLALGDATDERRAR
jgi:O-antigen ligase